jgi:hypothetical protein
MKKLTSFKEFLNESINEAETKTESVVIDLKFDGGEFGSIDDKLTLAMSPDSTGVFTIGKDIEKFCGIPEADVKKDVEAGKDKPDDAIIYGLCNIMNGGGDVYFWTNGTRLGGAAAKDGNWSAIIEQISHECTHLARHIIVRAIAKKKKLDITNEDWVKHDYGAGEYNWPAVGDANDKNPLIQIDEESFSTVLGSISKAITPAFLKMAKAYIKDLNI